MQKSSQPSARPRWLWWLIGVVLSFVVVCAIIGVVGWRWLASNSLLGDEQEKLTTAQIENIGRIQLPPSAAGIQARAGGFQDRFISIRFDMLPKELDVFLKATRYTPSISPTTELPFQSISDDAPWWRPQDAQRFEAGENFVDGISQTVLVDMTSTERYIVYVQTFET
ncbi:MAG: hypothetical protein ABIV47_27865 [Roseiflexaceae bacterium]